MKSRFIAIALLCAAACPAWAADATPEEARRIKSVMQRYVGTLPGVVEVTPRGDTYELAFDPKPLLALLPGNLFTFEASPFTYAVKPLGGGRWNVAQDGPFRIAVASSFIDVTLTADRLSSHGIFDEALEGFSEAVFDMENYGVTEVVHGPPGGDTQVEGGALSYHIDLASKGTADAADIVMHVKATGGYAKSEQSIPLPSSPGGTMRIAYDYSADLSEGGTTITANDNHGFNQLIAYFVAHPDAEAIRKSQEELRGALTGALPLFAKMSASSHTAGFKLAVDIDGQKINATAAEVEANIELSGLVADAAITYGGKISGITASGGLIKGWMDDLIPSEAEFRYSAAGLNLEAPIKLAIGAFDLNANQPLPMGIAEDLLPALLPKGAVTATVSPFRLVAPASAIAISGTIDVGPSHKPVGHGKAELSSFDGLVGALQNAPAELNAGQIIGALAVAKSFARVEGNGALTWDLVFGPDGGVSVNGKEIVKAR